MIGPRLHDRYILRAFVTSFLAVIVFFTLIVVIVHLAERSTRLLRNWDELAAEGHQPLLVLGTFYGTLVPFIWMQILPAATALAAALTVTRLTRHGELGPLVAAGVSTRRIAVPILAAAVVLAGLLVVIQESVVPLLSRTHLRSNRLLSKSSPDRITELPHFSDAGGARLSAAAWKPITLELEGALLTLRDDAGEVAALRWYPVLAWDEDEASWRAPRGGTFFGLEDGAAPGARRPIAPEAPVPLEAGLALLETSIFKDQVLGLSTSETRELLAAHPENPRLQRLHHEQLSRPVSVLVMLLLTLPFALRLGRRSAIPGVAAALGSSTLFYAATFLVGSLTSTGLLDVVVITWTPTVLFGSLGLALYLTMTS